MQGIADLGYDGMYIYVIIWLLKYYSSEVSAAYKIVVPENAIIILFL